MLKFLLMFLFGGFCGCFFTCLIVAHKVKYWQQSFFEVNKRLKEEMFDNLKLAIKLQTQRKN